MSLNGQVHSGSTSIAAAAPAGDRRAILVAARDRLARETDDARWAKHKRECHCTCGIGDGRVLVALVKELRAVMEELEALPDREVKTPLDHLDDELEGRRAVRRTAASGS